MSPWCLQPSFSSDLWFERRCRFEEFQDGHHLGYQNGTILVILNLHVALMLWFGSIRLTIWAQILFEEFQDGPLDCHLGTVLTILYLHVTLMPLTKFQLNPNLEFENICGLKIFKMARVTAILDIKTEWLQQISIFMLPWCLPPSFGSSSGGRCGLKSFKMAIMAATLDIGADQFYTFLMSMSPWCLPSSFNSIRLTVWEMLFKEFQNGCMLAIFKSEWIDFNNSESPCHSNASHHVSVQYDLLFRRRCPECEKLTMHDEWTDNRHRTTGHGIS